MTKVLLGAIALVSAGLAAAPASAAITFNLSNVKLADPFGVAAGTLTGSFTTNDARSTILSYNIVAAPAGSFPGFTYTPQNSAVSASVLPSQYFQLSTPGRTNELRLYFTAGLGPSGGIINPAFSYEFETAGGSRFPTGSVVAQVTAVPELATWAMMILGIGLVGGALRRRPAVRARIRFA